MRIVGGDVSSAGESALTLATRLAEQVADLEATPWAITEDHGLGLAIEGAVTELRHQVAAVLTFATALGATPQQISAVDQRLANSIPLTRGRRSLTVVPLRLAELAGTLTAESVVAALPPGALRLIDPVTGLIPDGPGWALPTGPPAPTTQTPRSAADWLSTVTDAQVKPGQIEVTHLANGRWVVSLPGIHSFTEAADPLDLPGAAHAFGTGRGAYAGGVVMALTLAGVPVGAQLMLVGHSQGGIVAADLAADHELATRWRITQLLTAAAPVGNTPLPEQTGLLALRNRDDLVPALDLRGDDSRPPHTPARTTVDFDAERGNVGANHDLAATYVPYARSSAFTANPAVHAWEVDARPYLTGGPATVQRFQLLDRAPAQAAPPRCSAKEPARRPGRG